MKLFAKFIATGFGSGLAPFAPGTFGTLMAFLISGIVYLNALPFLQIHIILIVLAFILGIWSINLLEAEWGHDPGKIVIDEFVGLWICYLFIPINLQNLIIGFVLFRIFDISKILGIKKLEKLPRALGVMADDMLAGLYANICLQLICYFIK